MNRIFDRDCLDQTIVSKLSYKLHIKEIECGMNIHLLFSIICHLGFICLNLPSIRIRIAVHASKSILYPRFRSNVMQITYIEAFSYNLQWHIYSFCNHKQVDSFIRLVWWRQLGDVSDIFRWQDHMESGYTQIVVFISHLLFRSGPSWFLVPLLVKAP